MAKINFNNKSKVIIVYVEIKIKDRMARLKMALDTGATYIMIPWDVAETLGLEPGLSKEKTEMITVSGVEKTPIVTLEAVSVAGNEIRNIKALVHDLPPKSYVDGLLGLSFLKNFNIYFNFEQGFLELTRQKL